MTANAHQVFLGRLAPLIDDDFLDEIGSQTHPRGPDDTVAHELRRIRDTNPDRLGLTSETAHVLALFLLTKGFTREQGDYEEPSAILPVQFHDASQTLLAQTAFASLLLITDVVEREFPHPSQEGWENIMGDFVASAAFLPADMHADARAVLEYLSRLDRHESRCPHFYQLGHIVLMCSELQHRCIGFVNAVNADLRRGVHPELWIYDLVWSSVKKWKWNAVLDSTLRGQRGLFEWLPYMYRKLLLADDPLPECADPPCDRRYHFEEMMRRTREQMKQHPPFPEEPDPPPWV